MWSGGLERPGRNHEEDSVGLHKEEEALSQPDSTQYCFFLKPKGWLMQPDSNPNSYIRK